MQNAFGVEGVAVGAIGGLVAYRLRCSWALAVFVFLIGQYVAGRSVCDLITDSNRLWRALYFGLLPVGAVGLLVASYRIGDTMWLSVLIGLVGGWVAQQIIGYSLVRGIWAEERADDLEHVRGVFS